MERSGLNSPYRFWRSGFVFEIVLYLGFVAFVIGLSVLVWLIVG